MNSYNEYSLDFESTNLFYNLFINEIMKKMRSSGLILNVVCCKCVKTSTNNGHKAANIKVQKACFSARSPFISRQSWRSGWSSLNPVFSNIFFSRLVVFEVRSGLTCVVRQRSPVAAWSWLVGSQATQSSPLIWRSRKR